MRAGTCNFEISLIMVRNPVIVVISLGLIGSFGRFLGYDRPANTKLNFKNNVRIQFWTIEEQV